MKRVVFIRVVKSECHQFEQYQSQSLKVSDSKSTYLLLLVLKVPAKVNHTYICY